MVSKLVVAIGLLLTLLGHFRLANARNTEEWTSRTIYQVRDTYEIDHLL